MAQYYLFSPLVIRHWNPPFQNLPYIYKEILYCRFGVNLSGKRDFPSLMSELLWQWRFANRVSAPCAPFPSRGRTVAVQSGTVPVAERRERCVAGRAVARGRRPQSGQPDASIPRKPRRERHQAICRVRLAAGNHRRQCLHGKIRLLNMLNVRKIKQCLNSYDVMQLYS